MHFEARNGGQSLRLVAINDQGSKYVINEIFNEKCYPIIPFLTGVRLVVDIGANMGLAAAYFRLAYPEAHIVCFEPDDRAYRVLQLNADTIGNCKACQFGLYDKDVTRPFYPGVSTVTSSIVNHSHTQPETSQVIHLKNASKVFIENGFSNGIDIMKIDTEGCEVKILDSIRPFLNKIKIVYLEFHSEQDRRLIDDLLAPSHALWHGSIEHGHRGQLCYVPRDLLSTLKRIPFEPLTAVE